MKRSLLITFSFALLSLSSFAQDGFSGYINFSPTVPMGEYKEVYDRTAWGGRAGVLYQPYRKLPVKIGIDLGYVTQGFNTQYYNSIGFSQFSDYRARARLNIFSGLVNLRIQEGTDKKTVNPFVEALAGWNNFYGSAKLEGRNPAKDYNWERIDRESTKGYWGFTYGGSAGLDIFLSKKEHTVALEIKVAYMKGARTKYYTDPQVDANGYASFALNESKTDMLIPQIGLKFGW